tara:strand:+ start:172 stop:402 length:231 start_codon:yes stop_codon:yes gene_type:complete
MITKSKKKALGLMENPEVDSLWEYSTGNGNVRYAGYPKGQYCNVFNFSYCSALKHDGEITGMGREFMKEMKGKVKA